MDFKASGIMTLTSDFGLADPFVGTMKGVMLRINPALRFVDISHQIPPQDILEGSFCLQSAYAYFPSGTVHLAVVDPGVGSLRRPLIAVTRDYLFVGPDNGLFSFVFSDPTFQGAYGLTAEKYFLRPAGATFHGRDVFAPAAAWLSAGTPIEEMGQRIHDPMTLKFPEPRVVGTSEVQGEIIHVDRFGNLISNISQELYERLRSGWGNRPIRISILAQGIGRIVRYYGEGSEEEPFALFNSSGLVEIFWKGSNAAQKLGVKRGEKVHLYVV
ncbi:MAG: SAM-dependent chlorinase/fluorinase [Candidatus Tectomicrobia bacterium]|uniref:SAM-dependent chlorinase/fluorinase n=1 Tax=Tectimicrobiota bacterium TaxID=2528274 RepID=A0A932GQG5_UNCTE|nr:SAM-dependent chlorinase/fluorinase [Candidatus Tectomicrobia bacterium]